MNFFRRNTPPVEFEVRQLESDEFRPFGTYENTMLALVQKEIRPLNGRQLQIFRSELRRKVAFAALDPAGNMLGMAILNPSYNPDPAAFSEESPYLDYLAVNREHQKKQGIGRALLGACQVYAMGVEPEADIATLRLQPRKQSIPFYERLGYEPVPDTIYMEAQLERVDVSAAD